MIYTSYFAKLKSLPSDIIPVSIAAKTPDWYNGLIYKALAPSYDILMKYKKDNDELSYTHEYAKQLYALNPARVVAELAKMTSGKDICLLCYEKPSNFCHRKIVATWLSRYGYDCEEWKNK